MQILGKEYEWQITNAMEPSTLHFEAQRSAPYLKSLLSILIYAHYIQKLHHTCKALLYQPHIFCFVVVKSYKYLV
jgi:hypothetical protein